jgi:hypothetical protein
MTLVIKKHCSIKSGHISINGKPAFSDDGNEGFKKFVRAAYKHFEVDYPKFFKMDSLSKLGFLVIEILLQGEDVAERHPAEKSGIILTNASSSLEVDEKHFDTIKDRNQYFPSPSNFVYTLPNIMAGEAAIRHKLKGENTVLISEIFDEELIFNIVDLAFQSNSLSTCICGWVEQYAEQYEAMVCLVEDDDCSNEVQKSTEDIIFEPSNLLKIYKHN